MILLEDSEGPDQTPQMPEDVSHGAAHINFSIFWIYIVSRQKISCVLIFLGKLSFLFPANWRSLHEISTQIFLINKKNIRARLFKAPLA